MSMDLLVVEYPLPKDIVIGGQLVSKQERSVWLPGVKQQPYRGQLVLDGPKATPLNHDAANR